MSWYCGQYIFGIGYWLTNSTGLEKKFRVIDAGTSSFEWNSHCPWLGQGVTSYALMDGCSFAKSSAPAEGHADHDSFWYVLSFFFTCHPPTMMIDALSICFNPRWKHECVIDSTCASTIWTLSYFTWALPGHCCVDICQLDRFEGNNHTDMFLFAGDSNMIPR